MYYCESSEKQVKQISWINKNIEFNFQMILNNDKEYVAIKNKIEKNKKVIS